MMQKSMAVGSQGMEVGVLVGGRGEGVGVGGSDVDVGVKAIMIGVYVGMG